MTNNEMLKAIQSGVNTTERLATGAEDGSYEYKRTLDQINDLRLSGLLRADIVRDKVVYIVTEKGVSELESA